jgi:general secretion pathway protein H
MPTSAVGNKVLFKAKQREVTSSRVSTRLAGFTLIELLVVIALIALGTAAVSFSLRDSAETALERDAERLAALFESARARSRTSGIPVQWHPQTSQSAILMPASKGTTVVAAGTDFVFEGLPPQTLPSQWLSPRTEVDANARIVLGPDPIIGPQSVALRAQQLQVWVSTDGMKPFTVTRVAP